MAKKTPVGAETLDDLLKSLLVLSRTVDHVLESRAVESAVGQALSSSKVQIIRLLGRRSGQTSTQVARYLGVTKPAVSQIIDSMVRAKMVVRKPTKKDRREVALELTKTGKTHYRAIRREQHHVLRVATRNAKVTGTKRWSDHLQGITAAIAQADKAFEDFCLQCGAHEDGTCILDGGDADCSFLRHCRTSPKRTVKTAKKTKTTKKTKRR